MCALDKHKDSVSMYYYSVGLFLFLRLIISKFFFYYYHGETFRFLRFSERALIPVKCIRLPNF